MRRGAIILCGGKSTRMGRDKATLPFGSETLLQRMVRLLSEVVSPGCIAVVAAADQALPALPSQIQIAHDKRPERGPLEGLAAGMRHLGSQVDVLYATSCDVPLLQPKFVDRMFELIAGHDIAVPREGQLFHPLAAAYRATVLPHIEELLSADQLRLRAVFDRVSTREISVDELRDVDTELATLKNLNRPEDYRDALKFAGFEPLDA